MGDQSQSSRRGFLIPLEIITQARKDGLGLETLQEMMRLSARCTHERGNRRYKDVVFMVVGKRVVAYSKVGDDISLQEQPKPLPLPERAYRCVTCRDDGKIRVFDQCDYCDGIGCSKCDEGLVPNTIPCPVCDQRKKLSLYR